MNVSMVRINPADKVKLKFKVGDWVVLSTSDGRKIVHIVSIEYFPSGQPRYITSEGKWLGNGIKAHLWTIQDAKDGDVLSDGTTIFIFKDLLSDGSVMSYCDYDTDSGESDAFCPLSVNLICSKITPAIKEQHDLLFLKMKEAGYEWDADKKELKKIELNEWVPKSGDICKPKKGGNNIILCEQNGIVFSFVEENGCAGGEIYIPTLLRDYKLVEPKDYSTFDIPFGAKDSELQEAIYYIPKGFYAKIDDNKVIIKKCK